MPSNPPIATDDGSLEIPELALVVFIGPETADRATLLATHFHGSEIVSTTTCRALLGDGPDDDRVSERSTRELIGFIAQKRLEAGRLSVVDAENLRPKDRQPLVHLAKLNDVKPVAIALAGPATPSEESLQREGFRRIHILQPAAVATTRIVRTPLRCNRTQDSGPFDMIGDVHGCIDELERLLRKLGYVPTLTDVGTVFRHPRGRRALFLGDLVDRGPATPRVLDLVMNMVASGDALCVPGNHDVKLARWLRGESVKISHGLAESLAQLDGIATTRLQRIADFIDDLPAHLVLDGGKLVAAHAGMKEVYQGRSSGRVLSFAIFGETTGERDDFGLPVRLDWAADYRGDATVVYGHTPVPAAEWHNETICIDTGCVFGGKLTALRYPERELVAVKASRVHYRPVKPLTPLRSIEPLAATAISAAASSRPEGHP